MDVRPGAGLNRHMKTIRVDDSLNAQLEEAARISGEPVSTIVRRAIEAHCHHILEQRLSVRLADVIGVVHSEGGRARRTGEVFAKQLRSRKETAR